jgi:hypothetical protein
MKITKLLLLITALIVLITAQNCTNSIWKDPYLLPARKGTTFRADVWPTVENDWTGRMAC